jgi:adenylate cyclase
VKADVRWTRVDGLVALAQLLKVDPNFTTREYERGGMTTLSYDPTFMAERARIIEGLRKAGLPEGPANTN